MVEWKTIGNSCKTISPPKKLEKELYSNKGLYPIIDQGQTNVIGYTDDALALVPYGEYVLFGDHTRYVKYHKGRFAQGADGLKILKAIDSLLPRYFFYALENTEVPSRGYSRHWSIAKELFIPIPSFSEQTRIVEILDTFTASIENLKQQITERLQQYEYYRNLLLDLEGKEGVEMKKIWQLTAWDKKFQGVESSMQVKIKQYSYLLAKDLFALSTPNGDVKLHSTGVQEGWTTEELAGDYLCEGEIVSIPWGKSPGAKNPVKYYNGKFVTGDNRIATSLDTNVLSNKFLYYWMCSKSDLIETFYRGAGIQHPSMYMVLTMPLPVPPISEQSRIVSILDTFEASIANLEAQLKLREKQYEYYRNKLLTF